MSANERTPTRDELLAMAYVDDELDEAARATFETRLRDEPALAREVTQLQRLGVLARSAAPPEPMDHEWARIRRGLPHRLGSPLAWIAILLGALGGTGWVLVEIARSDMETLPKILLFLGVAGFVLLFVLTLRARLRTLPYDPYTEIQR